MLVEIEGPDTEISVPYLRDILNQAKLYIRPLQCNVLEQVNDVEPQGEDYVSWIV